jgi:hypothetical protein
MTAFIPKTDLEWRDDFIDLFESFVNEHEFEYEDDRWLLLGRVQEQATRDKIESMIVQIREEAVRAHGNGEGAQ